MKKNLWGIVFSLCLFAALLPATAAAAEGDNIAKVGNTEYATIDEAVAAWASTNNSTLTLLADVTLSDVMKLSSTEYHILDLGTYTMTAASKKDAIQIVNNGRSSASYTLDIKADATNPGGITASGKTVVVTTGKSGVKDRPIIRFYSGVFNGSYIVKHSGSNGTNCPQFQFHGGVFNGTISTNRSLNQFYGGTFTGSLMMSVDSSAYTLISGGTFKNLSNLYMSALNSDKFTIGSAKGVYDKEVYIDASGNYVVAAAAPAEGYAASVSKTPGTNDYLAYSKVKADGKLNYTDVYTALDKNRTATVTVYVDELDLTNSSFKGTLLLPEEETSLTIIFAEGTTPAWKVDTNLKNRVAKKVSETVSDTVVTQIYEVEDSTTVALIDIAKKELQAAIDAKADAATVSAALVSLQSAIGALEAEYETADESLKAELEAKISDATETLGDAIKALEQNLNASTAALREKIDTKADASEVNAALAELQSAIDALEAVKDDYAADDEALKAELETKITDAKTAAVSAAEALVNSAKADLQTKIDTKADAAAVNTAIAKLQNAITVLEKAKDNYITADATLKAELETAIAKAKQEAIDAAKGHTPHIGENGNWWIGESDTGVSASGIPGAPGKDGVTPQLRINSENIWEVSYDGGQTWESMGISAVGASGANGQNGAPGQDGSDGVGIANIEKTSSNGNVDIYTITLTNGKTFPFTVTNGVDGKDGANGANGADGKDGESVSVVVPTVIGSAALVSNIGLIAWILSKKKVPV